LANLHGTTLRERYGPSRHTSCRRPLFGRLTTDTRHDPRSCSP
jgi:hypothetical protein